MNKKICYRNQKGLTLIEMTVTYFSLLLMLSMAFAFWGNMKIGSSIQQSQIDTRQNMRNAINFLQRDVRKAGYVIPNVNVTISGQVFNTPSAGETAQSILFAIPENNNSGSITYTVMGYFLEKNSKTIDGNEIILDEVNPEAYNLKRIEIKGVIPETPDRPETINLSSLQGGSFRTAAQYIDKDLFFFYLSDDGDYVNVNAAFKKRQQPNSRYESNSQLATISLRNKRL